MSQGHKTIIDKLVDSHYQPTKAEMEKEYDMPGASMDELRQAFFNPANGPGRSRKHVE